MFFFVIFCIAINVPNFTFGFVSMYSCGMKLLSYKLIFYFSVSVKKNFWSTFLNFLSSLFSKKVKSCFWVTLQAEASVFMVGRIDFHNFSE